MVTLVTGVPGWLGTALVQRLVTSGEEVRCLVQEGIDAGSLAGMAGEVIRGDLRKPQTLIPTVKDADTVFHLAALVHSRRIRDFFTVNAGGTRNLLEACRAADVKRFIHVSSDSVCGPQPAGGVPLTEDSPTKPITPYGRSKLLGESYVKDYHDMHGLRTTIIRPCWVYGPGNPPHMVYFMKEVGAGRFPLFGDGSNLVSMTYIDHVVSALCLALKKNRLIGETYFIADESPYPLVRVYRAVAQALGKNPRPLRVPRCISILSECGARFVNNLGFDLVELDLLGDFGHNLACSIEKAKRDFGYRPTVSIEEGMANAVAWSHARGML